MKKLSVVIFVLMLLLPVSALAEETGQQTVNPPVNQGTGPAKQNEARSSNPASWENMNEMQIALMIINKQIDYLMARVEDGDQRLSKSNTSYEDRLKNEMEKSNTLTSAYEQKLAQKDTELQSVQKDFNNLRQQAALFNNQSGVYLKIVLGFIAGILFGLILASILHLWKGRGILKT